MKILHVNKFLFRSGGAEGYMLDVAELQRRAGHEVAFFGMDDPRNPPLPHADTFAPTMQLVPPPDSAGERIVSAGRMVWSRQARAGMEAILDRVRPDVVHLHNIYHQLSPSVLRPIAKRRIPTVMTLHDYKLVCPTYLMLDRGRICDACVGRHFHQAVRRRCKDGSLGASTLLAAELALHTHLRAYGPIQRFICPSRFMLGVMSTGRVYPERLRHVPHFAELTMPPTDEPSDPVVLFAGRLAVEKGPDVVIRAAALLPPGLDVEVAGDGILRPELERLADEVAPGRVRFLGRLPKAELHDRLRRCRVVVVPSRCHENQPMSILEAFGVGVPVVASGLGGVPELVAPGIDGELVDADDPVALARAVADVAADPERARVMGRAGRARVEASFRPEWHLQRLFEIYEEAANEQSSEVR